MAACEWCQQEMSTARSCSVEALHRDGRRVGMVAFGAEPGWHHGTHRCGDCGVWRGGFHHPGCDVQRCPSCRGQMITCGCRFDEDDGSDDDWPADGEPLSVDGNGALVERRWLGDQEVIIHYDDVPESDITTVAGIRCTTPLRTLIDLAPEVEPAELAEMARDFLQRGLFTLDDAYRRLAEPDMAGRRGAELLRRALPA